MQSILKKPKIEIVDNQQLDKILEAMIQNDRMMQPNETGSPDVWKCKWYSGSGAGYSRGDAVWLNTENIDEFVLSREHEILRVINWSSELNRRYVECFGDRQKIIQLYKDIVTGTVSTAPSGEPLYWLGDITKPVQIRVSLSDDNYALPDDDSHWMSFFKNEDKRFYADQILSATADSLASQISSHMIEYHLSGIRQYWSDTTDGMTELSDHYALNDMTNITGMYDFDNIRGVTNTGFDYVVCFHCSKFKLPSGSETVKWFRIWNSGFLEHGGIVWPEFPTAGDSIASRDSSGNPVQYKVSLGWTDDSMTAPVYTYSASDGGFYSDDVSLDTGNSQPIQLPDQAYTLSPDSRYSIQITPIASDLAGTSYIPYAIRRPIDNITGGIYYEHIDACCMTNQSFVFPIDQTKPAYSYEVRGFSSNSQQRFK